jgi:hypothetical protein
MVLLLGLVGWLVLGPSAGRRQVAAGDTHKGRPQETGKEVRPEPKPAAKPAPVEPDPAKEPDAVELEIDPGQQIESMFGPLYTFGFQTPQPGVGKRAFKMLTASPNGFSNATGVRVDDKQFLVGNQKFGKPGKHVKLPADPAWETQGGDITEWPTVAGLPVLFRQTVERVPSKQSVPVRAQRLRRVLDTMLVRFHLENRDTVPHRVGLYSVLDTKIGDNDGVPFAGPGLPRVVNTWADFHTMDIPDFLQALEVANVREPGTVAQLTLRLGPRLEPPSRVCLTNWAATHKRVNGNQILWLWDRFQPAPFAGDSAVVLFWRDQELLPGEARNAGFTYGLGHIAADEGKGNLGVTLGGSFAPGEVFHVLAYVRNPVPGQTLTLNLGDGLGLADGEERVKKVRPLPQGLDFGYATVSWKVKGQRPGPHDLRVQSSEGDTQRQRVWIFTPAAAAQPAAGANKQ